jgi:hypothetical protein
MTLEWWQVVVGVAGLILAGFAHAIYVTWRLAQVVADLRRENAEAERRNEEKIERLHRENRDSIVALREAVVVLRTQLDDLRIWFREVENAWRRREQRGEQRDE